MNIDPKTKFILGFRERRTISLLAERLVTVAVPMLGPRHNDVLGLCPYSVAASETRFAALFPSGRVWKVKVSLLCCSMKVS
jgi:hypothetical protein